MSHKNEEKFSKNVKVFVQLSPDFNTDQNDIKILDDNKTIYARSIQDFGKGKNISEPNFWTFYTDGVLHKLDQEDIYKTVIGSALEKVIQGVDLIIMVYGQTGTGKSTTCHGLQYTYESRGISARIIEELFKMKEEIKHTWNLKFNVSFVEVEKYFFTDLLRKDIKKCYLLKDISKVKIKSTYAGLKELFYGEARRRSYSELLYVSHAATSVFTIYVKNRSVSITNPVDCYSKIHIIDMAGIDNCGNESCSWKKCKEVGNANLAKSQLELFLTLLQDYSTNKNIVKDFGLLIHYLRNSLTPKSFIRFIGHIKSNRNDLLITLSTLRFAHVARCIKRAKLSKIVLDSEKLKVAKLENELEFLKKQNYLNSMLLNEDLSSNITQSRIEQIKNTLQDYLQNKVNEISVLNVINANIILETFKEMYNKLETDHLNSLKQIELTSSKTKSKFSITGRNTKAQSSISTSSQNFSKRKSLSKTSAVKRISVEKKLSKVGSLTQSGTSVGLVKSTNFQGSVTKARKKSLYPISEKKSSRVFRHTKSMKSNIHHAESEVNLDININEDNESIWKSFKTDENYHYESIESSLKNVEITSRGILKHYNEVIASIDNLSNRIQSKRNDLFNIQLYKSNNNIKCNADEPSNLKNVEDNIEIEIVDLQNDLEILKERMYTIQAELKVNIDYYNKLKSDLKKEFRQYCLVNHKIEISYGEDAEGIEDKIILPEMPPEEVSYSTERIVFEELQCKMKKLRQKILNL